MRKRYFINPALVLMALLPLATSCELFDLDENPRSFTAPETYYNTPAQIETVISGTMSRSYRSWGANYAYNPGFHRHDDQNAGGNLVITMNYASDIWSLHWANIKDLNFAIAAMVEGKVEGAAPGQEEQLMGMLKFHRAWNYFQLVRHWGGLPLLTEADVPNYFVTMPARATVAQVYELIVADFTEAIAKLPEDWGELAGRPARDAARGLLAKAYLTMATAPLNDESNYARAAAMAR
ncbi:MAG: RagB/SusD family nutrient uptake outer membrane protein, partial [Alistipes sp.]|nr:RagB/SusD family nutrient uptake outer membrane protein [Alistipes sp.]